MSLLESQGSLHPQIPISWPQMVEQPMSSHPVTSEPAKPKQTQEERYTEGLDAVKYRPKYFRDSVERFAKCKNRAISIVPPKDMYVGPWEEWIEYEAILDLHINAKIDITFIHWWAMRLHLMVKILPNSKCVFLNPHLISSSECSKKVMDHIIATMGLNPGQEIYVAPYLQGQCHWLLFVVCPNLRKGYILDSKDYEGNNEKRYYFPEIIERALEIKFDWTLTKCSQQEGEWECGYYLMKFMHDLAINKQAEFPENLWDNTRHLTLLEINQVAFMTLTEFYRLVVVPLDTTAPQ